MLGKGGLLGNDASLNATRDQDSVIPKQARHRTSRSALGAVAPAGGFVLAVTAGAGGTTGSGGSVGSPGVRHTPGRDRTPIPF